MELADLDRYIKDLKEKQEELFLQYDEVHCEIEALAEQLSMAETVRMQFKKHYRCFYHANKTDERLQARFGQLTIKQMLIVIALESDGILDLSIVRQTLVRAGVFKDERNAATSIAPILSRHENTFRRVGKGLYVLTGHSILDEVPKEFWVPFENALPLSLRLYQAAKDHAMPCLKLQTVEGV